MAGEPGDETQSERDFNRLVTDMGRYIIICALHRDVCCFHTELLPGLKAATESPGLLALPCNPKALNMCRIFRYDAIKAAFIADL